MPHNVCLVSLCLSLSHTLTPKSLYPLKIHFNRSHIFFNASARFWCTQLRAANPSLHFSIMRSYFKWNYCILCKMHTFCQVNRKSIHIVIHASKSDRAVSAADITPYYGIPKWWFHNTWISISTFLSKNLLVRVSEHFCWWSRACFCQIPLRHGKMEAAFCQEVSC